jgi:hypothetical protein
MLEELIARIEKIEKLQGVNDATETLEDVDEVLEQVEEGRKAGVLGMIVRRIRELEAIGISAKLFALESTVDKLKEEMRNTDTNSKDRALDTTLKMPKNGAGELGAHSMTPGNRVTPHSANAQLQSLEARIPSHPAEAHLNAVEANRRRYDSYMPGLSISSRNFLERSKAMDNQIEDINSQLELIGSQFKGVESRLESLEDDITCKDEEGRSKPYRLQAMISDIVSIALEQETLIASKVKQSPDRADQISSHELQTVALETHNQSDFDRCLQPLASVDTVQALLSLAALSPALPAQLSSLDRSIQTLQDRFKCLSSTVANIMDTTANNHSRITSAESNLHSLTSTISSHTERSTALQSRIESLWKSWRETNDAHIHTLLAADLLIDVLNIEGLSDDDTLSALNSRDIISSIKARYDANTKTTAMRRAIVSQLTSVSVLNIEMQNMFHQQVAKVQDDDVEGALAAVIPMIVGVLNGLITNSRMNTAYPGQRQQTHFTSAGGIPTYPPGANGYWRGGKWVPY